MNDNGVSAQDTRYVYSAKCSWNGPIQNIGIKNGLPCCPHCGSMLFELPDRTTWDLSVAAYNARYPGYTEYIEWLASNGNCWSPPEAIIRYNFTQKKELAFD